MTDFKKRSEEIVLRAGGMVNPDLPELSPHRELRSQEAILGRMLALYAMVGQIYVVSEPIVRWLETNDLMIFVSPEERRLLASEVTSQEAHVLEWSIESIWAFAWMLSLVQELPFTWRAGEAIPEGFPNIFEGESCAALRQRAHLRPREEIMAQLDLYYRLGWWTRDRMQSFAYVEHVNYDSVMERLKALDWALSLEDWDEVDVRNR
ncbi:DUF4272 domain-containing protein [bacterium CPR1]|nr:DUF4272 domain-containing protein [bacterium CPR1]